MQDFGILYAFDVYDMPLIDKYKMALLDKHMVRGTLFLVLIKFEVGHLHIMFATPQCILNTLSY